MRELIWELAIKRHNEATVLSKPLLILRAILYPLDFFYWKMSDRRGYQWESDTWIIGGIKYTGATLRALSEAKGEVYKITAKNGCVNLERLDV